MMEYRDVFLLLLKKFDERKQSRFRFHNISQMIKLVIGCGMSWMSLQRFSQRSGRSDAPVHEDVGALLAAASSSGCAEESEEGSTQEEARGRFVRAFICFSFRVLWF